MVSVQQMTNLMEQNVNLQSWINKYINTIESLEEQIKQCQTDLAREKEKSWKWFIQLEFASIDEALIYTYRRTNPIG